MLADMGRKGGGWGGIRIPVTFLRNLDISKVYPRPYPRSDSQFGGASTVAKHLLGTRWSESPTERGSLRAIEPGESRGLKFPRNPK